ncbi:L-proline dehydrogenase [Seinonella peptonophila]|uniref:proline dehydrogenase n=1 Tax=Seinonella peptonophila TaxID=112248 RepID=A0A1M4TXA5_9BACL|nr:proline dehydrogenase family protein [Seinonella peptonophila]SHE49078.1 L-proline dehydrogenase [Seinonella peptonophila]
MFEQWMRSFFLFLAGQRLLNRLAKKVGLHLGARRFVAGESLSSVIQVAKQLNDQNLLVTMDHLGEFVKTNEEAEQMANHCVKTLHEINHNQVKGNLSLKLTSLGLDLDPEICQKHLTRILEVAEQNQIFVRIDMEDYTRLEKTFAIYQALRPRFSGFGLVIQAYLYRSEDDIKRLSTWKTNLRLVKGAYKESAKVAFPNKSDVDENYRKLIRLQLAQGNYAAIATHDPQIITYTKQVVKELNIPLDHYEFQMLYGIRPDLQQKLVAEGERVRVYVPYGEDWYGYFMRRLAERPANVAFVLRGVFHRKA